jgi:hypothetical protein
MPLRDPFRAPLNNRHSWEEIHGQWPGMIVQQLFTVLPDGYEAAPRVRLGAFFEIDIAAFEADETLPAGNTLAASGGGATALAAPPQPSLSIETDLPEQDEYEVRVYDAQRGRRLVAAIELVSPGNKDRQEHRQAFVAKCSSLLQQGVCVFIVDLVTIRDFNLYAELLLQVRPGDPTLADALPPLYAVTCRTHSRDKRGRFDAWTYPLTLGEPLPPLPIWLAENLHVTLDLEGSYEDTCRVLRIS